MKVEREQVLCRFQLSNFMRHATQPLYEWIVETARKEGLQGATVLKGFYGLRPDGSILQERTWSVSQELPVIVEIVDEAARIELLLGRVEPPFGQVVITLERAHVLLYRAREAHLAGATVLRGPMGFGRHSRMHAAKLLELSTDLPIVIEIVDAEDKVESFLPVVDQLVTEGLVTLEAVRIVRYVSPETR
jgi:uncharacterized protein